MKTLLRFRGFYLKLFAAIIVALAIPILTIVALDHSQKQTLFQKQFLQTAMERLKAPQVSLDGLLNDIELKTIAFTNNRVFRDINYENDHRDDSRRADMENEFLYFYNSLCCVDSMYLYYSNLQMVKLSNPRRKVQEVPALSSSDWTKVEELFREKQRWYVHNGSLLPKIVDYADQSVKVTLIRPIPSVGNRIEGFIIVNLNSQSLFTSPFQ